ncbi:MAG: S41 family peptidase [Alphaproteobacteria bacterium]|nr:S41 family peptidase [Alphaproteobacteria bacterium]
MTRMSLNAARSSHLALILAFVLAVALSAPGTKAYGENRQDEQELYNQLTLFGDVLEQVRRNYVDAPSDKELIEAALSGMMTSLDPHSAYLPPKNFEDMQVETKGEFGGLGIEVTMENGLVKVIAPIDDTPASRAGMRPNDLISELDGTPVLGLTLSEAVDLMRGEKGKPISLTVLREGEKEPLEITIIRDTIKIRAVRTRVEGPDENIAYIRLTTFNSQTTKNLKKAFNKPPAEIGRNKLAGFIIDLRNNPGGLLREAISVSDTMLDRGEIVSTRGRNEDDSSRFSARRGDMARGYPIVVMINGGSASASEIVAGALQDHHRAVIIGTPSFGKGSVQSIMPLGNDGALRMTTARYFTPSGRSIQAKGINPDIFAEQQLPEELQGREGRREADLRGALDGKDIDGALNNDASPDDPAKKRKTPIAFIPPEPEDDKQLQDAIDLLIGLQKSAAGRPAPNS